LVEELRGTRGVRTLVDDVIDAAHERVDRRLVFARQVERLHLADELRVRRWQHRPLARQVVLLPAQHVAEEPRRLVVEVVPGGEHTLRVDRALHLPAEEEQVAGPAEGGVVRAELDLGPRTAPPALHQAPPEMTARISISSLSSTTSPSVNRSSPRITMAVPGRMPSSASSAPTRRGP